MTTPQEPGADPQVEAEVIEDLDLQAESSQQVAGGKGTYGNSVNCQ